MMRSAVIVCLLAQAAYADKPASLAHYDKGKKAYAAGNFAEAVAEFEAAYAEWNTPEYLHDIGQAYRRLDRCNQAATSFEKYVAAKPDAPNRASVEHVIEQLRAKCPVAVTPNEPAAATTSVAEPIAPPHRAPAKKSEPAPVVAAATPAPAAAPAAAGVVAHVTARMPSPWHPTASAGVVFLDAGPVVMPPVLELRCGVLRDMKAPLSLQLGGNLSIERLPFDDLMTGTVWLTGAEAIAVASHPLAPKLALTGGLAVGAQLVSGLSTGNPFTMNGTAQDAFVALRVRAEVGIAWRASDRFTVRVTPGYTLTPRRAPLAPDIHALHGLALVAGVGLDL
jgi:hypothetical protein